MTTQQDLEAALRKLLGQHGTVATPGRANDAFEVYVLSLVLRAATEEQGAVEFESAKGVPKPNPLRFRTSPGRIFSPSHDYSHAVIRFPGGLEFEAHIGVYVQGLAGVVHECDVLVIDRDEGLFCRRTQVHPRKASMVLAAECKFYTGKLGIALGREFLGVTADLGAEARFLLSNSDGNTVNRVLAHHKRQRSFGLTPLAPDAENQTIAQFRNAFRNLRAKRA